MQFFLGTHRRSWLADLEIALCVSRLHFLTAKGQVSTEIRPARSPWFLDSGAFSEVERNDGWTLAPRAFVVQVRAIVDAVGHVVHIGPQDWMCEPEMLAKTGFTVAEHQALTVANFCELRDLAADLPWVPVLQGHTPDDYYRCIDAYTAAGVVLENERLVGLGSVCRRSHLRPIAGMVSDLAAAGLRLHGFGMKVTGLRRFGWALASADSSSWSFDGRMPKGGRCGTHEGSCANCQIHALMWRDRLLRSIAVQQPAVWA